MNDGRLKYRPRDNLTNGENGLGPEKYEVIRGLSKSKRHLSQYRGKQSKAAIHQYSKYQYNPKPFI